MFGEWVQAVGAKASGVTFVDGIQHITNSPDPKKIFGPKACRLFATPYFCQEP